jgi:hypothetical protein
MFPRVIVLALLLTAPAAGAVELRYGVEIGGTGASLLTGNPYRPSAAGAGLVLGVRIGAQLNERFGVYWVNRAPAYLFASHMPGLGVAFDVLDFNAVMLQLSLRYDLSVSLGPSFDAMVPVHGNRAIGGGADFRLAYQLSGPRVSDDKKPRITLGLDVHPSLLAYTETHGFFAFHKRVLVAGLSLGAEWG